MTQTIRSSRLSFVLAAASAAGALAVGRAALAGAVVAEDFEKADAAVATVAGRGGVNATVALTQNGTIDSYMGKPGRCAEMIAWFPNKATDATAADLTVNVATAGNGERDLARLTLSADVWVYVPRPVGVRVRSLDAAGKPTGTLAGTWLPPVGGAWYRHEADLSDLKPVDGTFDPTAAKMSVTLELTGVEGRPVTLRVDNVSLSAPSYFVSGRGDDQADGRTEATAFATVQRGVDAAGPGDTVMVLDGTYRSTEREGLVNIAKPGTPAKWITVRPAPGASPKLTNVGWHAFKLDPGSAYVELRNLDVSGNRANVKLEDALADGATKEKDGKKYPGDPIYNGNGISADGRKAADGAARPHHLRFVNNHVHDNCGAGVSAIACDYITIANNDVHDNCHYMRYGGSGISCLNLSNFDESIDHHTFYLNNVLHNNRCYVPWAQVGHMSDGNSMIVDVNRHPNTLDGEYHARTLIANNLCVGGGGGGVTITSSAHVDIVNNTLFQNTQTEELAKAKYPWGDLFISGPLPNCLDVRAFNNIVCSGPGRSIVVAGRAEDYTFLNNVFFGDPGAPVQTADAGDADNLVADPELSGPSLTAGVEAFRPVAGSPAIGHGRADGVGVPLADLTGRLRPPGKVTAGALLPADEGAKP